MTLRHMPGDHMLRTTAVDMCIVDLVSFSAGAARELTAKWPSQEPLQKKFMHLPFKLYARLPFIFPICICPFVIFSSLT